MISSIDCSLGKEYIKFANGQILKLYKEIGSNTEEIIRAQIRVTIKEHLDKERQLRHHNVKVLSLFFIR